MEPSNLSCAVALSRERNNATTADTATSDATATRPISGKPLPLHELRSQLRAQLTRNQCGNHEAGKRHDLRTSKVGAGDTPSKTSWGWLIHYADRDPVECYICPVVTHAELMKLKPDAIGAEPLPDLPEIQELEDVANINDRRSAPEDYLSTFLLA